MTKRRRVPKDAQPLPDSLRGQVVEIVELAQIVDVAYRREHGYGWPPAGSGVHVMSGTSNPTETALLAPEQADSRERCRRSAARVNAAVKLLREVAVELTTGEVQPPERSADTVVTRHEFETARARAEHERRERALRESPPAARPGGRGRAGL